MVEDGYVCLEDGSDRSEVNGKRGPAQGRKRWVCILISLCRAQQGLKYQPDILVILMSTLFCYW